MLKSISALMEQLNVLPVTVLKLSAVVIRMAKFINSPVVKHNLKDDSKEPD